MKLISFSVNNFRGISGGLKKNTIDFKNSNTIFIFGQNNVGKSTFLKSYEFFYYSTSIVPSDYFKMQTSSMIEFELILHLDSLDFKRIEENAPRKLQSLKDNWLKNNYLKIRRTYSSSGIKNYTLKNDNVNWDSPDVTDWSERNYGGIGLDRVFQSLLPKPIFINAMPDENEVEKIINTILADKVTNGLKDKERKELIEAQEKIKSLQDKLYNPEAITKYKEGVNTHFKELFPNIKIDLIEKDKVSWTEAKFGKKFSIDFKKLRENGSTDDNIPSQHSNIGHGAIRTAIFTLLLMRDIAEEFVRKKNRKDYIVLFEEPELFLHPNLMKELRTLIYKVTEDDLPYQVLCASHSPQMIDISKPKSSLVRMVTSEQGTEIFQINEDYLKKAKNVSAKQLKEEMLEVLRFNPFICESFYSDEVILIEGPTEEIILRGYLTEVVHSKNIFIVNCGSVTNIPFYQKIFSKFNIKYHVICDTDGKPQYGIDTFGNPVFKSGIQRTIYEQIKLDSSNPDYSSGLFRVHITTFEPAHKAVSIHQDLRMPNYTGSLGKPFYANKYWKEVLSKNLNHININQVPILKFTEEIILH